ncbi:MAG: hypothetical protein JWM30_3844 [Burkholderia sp.]|jgi:hypothetical protein|nr:hypothetical protein [Burkholderia sp.]
MNAPDSHLYCDRCDGIGYVQAVLSLGRQPINAQRDYFRRWHQYQVNYWIPIKSAPTLQMLLCCGRSPCRFGEASARL